jgi:hypothetical protein
MTRNSKMVIVSILTPILPAYWLRLFAAGIQTSTLPG